MCDIAIYLKETVGIIDATKYHGKSQKNFL